MDAELILFDDDGMDLNVVLGVVEMLLQPIQIVDNDVQQRREIPRNENYFETVIPRYDDISFREHFRMSREAFEVISNFFCGAKKFNYLNNF